MMKKIALFILCCALCTYPRKAEAQILKKIGQKVERSVERRVERKVDKGIEKGLDKAEDGTEKAVDDAISSDKKSDKRSEIKTLPDDYQIEITGSGPDLYLEYQMRVQDPDIKDNQVHMSMILYASPQSGNGRAETTMDIPVFGEMRMAVLTNMNKPERVVMLNERKQQYTVMDLSESTRNAKSDDVYKVNKLGTVNLRGIECVHSEAVNQDGERFEMWTTRAIPGYQDMAALYAKSQQMGSDNLWKAMQEADCTGFMVKLKVEADGTGTVMELVEIQKTSIPVSMFQIPEGYKETKGGWANGFMK